MTSIGYGWKENSSLTQDYYFNPKELKQVENAIYRNPDIEIGLNTYNNIQQYGENLDTGIYTYHTRGEILNLKSFSTLERLERNSSIYAATNNFKLSVIEPKVIVKAANKSYNAGLLKEFIEFNLAEMEGTINDACYDILSALLPGYSITEKVYQTATFEGEYKKIIKAFKSKKAGLYSFYIDAFDNIQAVRSLIGNDAPLPKEKFIIYSFLKKNGNPYGFPLFDVLYPLYFAINELQKFMLIGAAKFSNPSVVISVPNGASDAVLSAVSAFASDLTQSSVATLPESVKAGILDITNKSRNPYIDLLKYFISEIEKVLLLNDLTVSQSGKYGSRAESSVKVEQGKLPLVRYTRRNLEDTFKEQFIKSTIKYNFNAEEFPTSIYPSLLFNDENKADKQIFVSMVSDLTDKGYMNAESDKEWVMETVFEEAPKEMKKNLQSINQVI